MAAKIIHPEYCQQSYVTVIQASSEKAMFDERTAVIAGDRSKYYDDRVMPREKEVM